MTKRVRAKYKFDRKIGQSLWGLNKNIVAKRGTGIGEHGKKSHSKLSDYGLHLKEKQKLKKYYGEMTEKQFKAFYKEAVRLKGDTSVNLIGLLESTLRIVVHRLKFAPTIFASRQMINHCHILVNGKKNTCPNYILKPGDIISLKDQSKSLIIVESLAKREDIVTPEYLELDWKAKQGKFLRIPQGLEEVPYPIIMQPNMVVEYYSL